MALSCCWQSVGERAWEEAKGVDWQGLMISFESMRLGHACFSWWSFIVALPRQ
jgi:hypothetical protein